VKYNLKNKAEASKAFEYLTDLVGKESLVEVKKISQKRTLNQNSYFHLLLGIYGLETGSDIEYAKALYKWVNKNLYYKKFRLGDEVFLHIRSSADLTKEEMQKSIDKFMLYASENGIDLPPAEDKELLRFMENRLEQEGNYL
jgi:hypothetical protein